MIFYIKKFGFSNAMICHFFHFVDFSIPIRREATCSRLCRHICLIDTLNPFGLRASSFLCIFEKNLLHLGRHVPERSPGSRLTHFVPVQMIFCTETRFLDNSVPIQIAFLSLVVY